MLPFLKSFVVVASNHHGHTWLYIIITTLTLAFSPCPVGTGPSPVHVPSGHRSPPPRKLQAMCCNKWACRSYLLPHEVNSDLHKYFEWQAISVRNSLSVLLVSSDAMDVLLKKRLCLWRATSSSLFNSNPSNNKIKHKLNWSFIFFNDYCTCIKYVYNVNPEDLENTISLF